MSKLDFNSKIYIGLGAANVLAGAVFLSLDSRILGVYIYLILSGIGWILSGISYILGVTVQGVTRRLSLIFIGAALAFLVMDLASLWP